ncbi:sensor histidine kinase [Georgfuchsia toluolica]|uniref:sensor histidine kinase n=1 Tax=Georgfuchsia toluolica TaxID=424218 RepID=UPI001C73C7FF|nr:sensor histidine kinase [Georgfuchsia toluolica]
MRLLLAGGFVVLLVGMLFMGTWISSTIEERVVHHEGEVFALYLDSLISDHVESIASNGQLSSTDVVGLDKLFSGTEVGKRIVTFKMWSRDGRIIYSTNPALIGRQFKVKPDLAMAFRGETKSHLSDITDDENLFERQRWSRLLEIYAPMHERKTGSIVGVAEIYQTTDVVARAVGTAKLKTWLVVIAATLVMYLLLAALIKRASNIIAAQQNELHDKVRQLTALLAQNEQLHERVRRAGGRAAAINEQTLNRIAADLHDGPAQGLALALMRMGTLAESCGTCSSTVGKGRTVADEFRTLHSALQSARDELHAIAAGLPLPEIERLTLTETAQRALHDYERKVGFAVPLTVDELPSEAPLPVKITLYRLLQESLANGFRHGAATDQRVRLTRTGEQLIVDVTDSGKGFDLRTIAANGHLGLAGMRERVEILGGSFSVQSAPGSGTLIRASLPLRLLEEENE